MKTSRSRRHFIAVAVGLGLIATFILWISHALQEATDNYRRQQRLYGDKWLAEQKEALRSGKQSYVYFYSTSDTDSLLAEFTGMPEVRSLTFELTDLTDAGVKSIIELPNIKKLTLYGGKPRVGDDGLAILKECEKLEILELVNIDVTDDGLAVLRSFPRLKDLTIYRDGFRERLLTDTAVRDLRKLNKLTRLNVAGGWMSKTAVAELRRSLPDCEVVEKSEW